MTHRYLVGLRPGGHVVRDSEERMRPVFSSGSKSECVAECQRLNGFSPTDGDEQTYARQIAAAKGERR